MGTALARKLGAASATTPTAVALSGCLAPDTPDGTDTPHSTATPTSTHAADGTTNTGPTAVSRESRP